jgi:hypothetical protein
MVPPTRAQNARDAQDITNQRHDRAQRCLAADAVRGPVHLDEKRNGDHRANSPTNRSENDVLETERIENIAPRHDQKAGKPRTRELLGSSPAKAADPQFIERNPTQVHRGHLSTPRLLEFNAVIVMQRPDRQMQITFRLHRINSE